MGRPSFDAVAAKLVIAALDYLDERQKCPFCQHGHARHPDDDVDHAKSCPLQGYERTVDCDALRAWAAPRSGNAGGSDG